MRTIIVCLVGAGTLAGCGSGSGSGLAVVASTNVYGDIAAQIGGPRVHVTSILDDPNADPHLFEPGTRSGLAVSRARVAIQNGAGYDDFMLKLEHAAPSGRRIVVTVADLLRVHGHEADPHLWYDLPRIPHIAAAIAAALERSDPKHAKAYELGLAQFLARLQPLLTTLARDFTTLAGKSVATTEPLPDYLLTAIGVRNLAPSGFTRAIEDGTEPAPGAVAAMDALIDNRAVDALLYNSQAVSPVTARVRSAARRNHIPVVAVSETLPPGEDFQQWQGRQLRELERALTR